MTDSSPRIIVSSIKRTRGFILWATVFAFIVSFWFLQMTFNDYYAFTDQVEDHASVGVIGEEALNLAPATDPSAEDVQFEQEDFAVIGAVMFGIMGILALFPLVMLSRLRRHVVYDESSKTLAISRTATSSAERIALSEIESVVADDPEFGEDFNDHSAHAPQHEHDLLITLKNKRVVKVACPSYQHAQQAAAELEPLL